MELKDKASGLTKSLTSNVTSLNIQEQDAFLKDTKSKVETQVSVIEDIENKLDRINISLAKQKIKEKVKEIANVEFKD
ncbi:hypothetical protein ACFL1B_04745 [Nanoarchaeota archaeon]